MMVNKSEDMMKQIHELKTYSDFFRAVERGEKTFEVRKNDRNYAVGDVLRLRDYDPNTETYSGDELRVHISYILHGGQFGIEDGYCVMGLRRGIPLREL